MFVFLREVFVFFSIEFALKIVETAQMVPGRGPTCLACRAELIGIGVRILSEVFVKCSFSVRLVFGFYQDPSKPHRGQQLWSCPLSRLYFKLAQLENNEGLLLQVKRIKS